MVKVEGKEVWRGLNPTKAYAEIKHRTQEKKFPSRGESRKKFWRAFKLLN